MAIVDDFSDIKAKMEHRPSKDDMLKAWFRNLSLEEKEAVLAKQDSLKAMKKEGAE